MVSVTGAPVITTILLRTQELNEYVLFVVNTAVVSSKLALVIKFRDAVRSGQYINTLIADMDKRIQKFVTYRKSSIETHVTV